MYNRIRQLLLLIAAGTTVSCCALVADDSGMSIVNGGAVQPLDQHPSIRMVREAVDIKLGKIAGDDWPVFVRCQFQFNNDGPATDATIGFPEAAEAGGDTSFLGRLKGFKSWVDGKQAVVKYMPSSKNPKGELAQRYKAWYVKKVHFDAGQSRTVVDVYSARLGVSGDSSGEMSFNFAYILRTGANWKGLIDEAIIRADESAAGKGYSIEATPSGYKSRNGKFTWTFKSFKPKQDIAVSFARRFPLLNGEQSTPNWWSPYYERNGVVMTGLTFISNDLGGGVDVSDGVCTVTYGRHVLRLRSGSKVAMFDGKRITLAHSPQRQDESDEGFAVPLDEIVRLLGGSVKYDSNHTPDVQLKEVE